MTLTTRLYTFFNGSAIGTDADGNRYFREKRTPKNRREKRWVLYNGAAEPSRVPPEWHGWLHYTTDVPPTRQSRKHYGWEKPPQPNLTGTPAAFLPPGHLQKSGRHEPTTAGYEPWRP